MQFKLLMFVEQERRELSVETPVVIGRSKQADVTLGHPLISRRHCEITEGDDDLLVIEDLGSLNGTVVGEERIEEPVYLEPGDVFSVGEVTFQAVYGDFVPDEDDSAAAETLQADVEDDEGFPDFAAMADDEPEPAAVAVEDAAEEDAEVDEEVEAVEFAPDETEEVEAVETFEVVEDEDEPEAAEAEPEEATEALEEVAEDEGAETGEESGKSADDQAMDWLSASDDEEEDKANASADDDLDDFFKSME